MFIDGTIHLVAYKPDVIKCWEMQIKYVDKERPVTKDGKLLGGISMNGNRKMELSIQSAQLFTPTPSGAAAATLKNQTGNHFTYL